MNIHKKLRWYRFDVARKIRSLEGTALVETLQEILLDIEEKKYDQYGVFRQFASQIQNEIEKVKHKPKPKARQYDPFLIKKAGDGRIVLFGMSNVGKSTFMNAITNTDVKTGNYLHTTQTALAGTCEFENIKIQLIDVPGFIDYRDDWSINKQILRVARTADAILLVIDLSQDIQQQYQYLMRQLELANLIVQEEALYSIGILATKGDLGYTKEKFVELQALTPFITHPVSIQYSKSLQKSKQFLFQLLDVIRIYTKAPHHEPDLTDPIIVPKGSILEDVAEKIHKDFIALFHYGKIWGTSVEFPGQHVGKDHELEDEDVIEIVLK